MLSLINDTRKKELAHHLQAILGRSVRINVRETSDTAPDAPGQTPGPHTADAGMPQTGSAQHPADPPADATQPPGQAASQTGPVNPPAGSTPGQPQPGGGQAASGQARSQAAGLRQHAMELPLVREVLQQFPNASLTHIDRPNNPPTPGNAQTTPAPDAATDNIHNPSDTPEETDASR
jgi:hypothetical protein